ncbi:tetratricopeptide repeat protein [Neisseria animaloris]|uniref:tetratricopeptide repeat protein n=1 Tax=Neisseria animaloris TaxID=326522 RepID=UPI00131C3A42|nr:tetratricopeptide repeat protein [Neisseria animaloris]
MDADKLIDEGIRLFNAKKYDEAIEKFYEALRNSLSKNADIQSLINAHFWLAYCHYHKAINETEQQANLLLDTAIYHLKQILDIYVQLPDKQQGLIQKNNTLTGLVACYSLKGKKTTNKDKAACLFNEAKNYLNEHSHLLKDITDTYIKAEAQSFIKANHKELHFLLAEYETYFKNKQKDMQDKLPDWLDTQLKEYIASILAVLTISPREFNKPLAHYTNPFVCEKLLGIEQIKPKDKIKDEQGEKSEIKPSTMRMNSSTYVNDPYEGKSLLDFCGIQEISLENKTEFRSHNAFFACFSTRVNDLNQFRLYGKANNIEASGCCLVFNKHGNWVKEPDIHVYLPSPNDKDKNKNDKVDNLATGEMVNPQRPSENLPLYQVAYIFYRDEYVEQDEYDVFDGEEQSFGVRLKPISDNKDWHEERKKQLKNALKKLQEHFRKNNKADEQKQADQSTLEYIRYLFKDYAFRDEEEFRLLQIEALGSETVQYCHETNSVYVEYADICDKLDEVILGTNYERAGGEHKVEAFRYLLKQKLPHIKVSHSSLPINAALPARKP